jgi:hypothetical protein
MTRRRNRLPLSLSAHGAVELLGGIALIIAPTALGVGTAGVVVTVILGSILMGMGMMLQSDRIETVSLHSLFDGAFLLVSAAAAVALALAGEHIAAVTIAAFVAVQSLLTLTTRYVAAG